MIVKPSANARMVELLGQEIDLTAAHMDAIMNFQADTVFNLWFCGVILVGKRNDKEIEIMSAITNKQQSVESTYEKLYKNDSKGKVRVWWMEQLADKYRTHSGIQNGNIVTSEWTVAKPKNVGRSNETSGEEQAFREIQAKYKKKREQSGYGATLSEAKVEFVEPMLAKKFTPSKIKFADGICVQPKLDGIRCLTRLEDGLVTMRTRKGKLIPSCPHVAEDLKEFFATNPDAVLDGELYNHQYRDQFQKLVSVIRKQKPTAEQMQEASEVVQYHVYDTVSPLGFTLRQDVLIDELNPTIPLCSVVIVPTHLVLSEDESDELHAAYMEQGYEGTMYRDPHAGYEQKRSSALQKRKEFQDDEFTIADVIEGEGNRSGMAGKVEFMLDDGSTFKANPRGNFDFYRHLLENKDDYIGNEATVRFMGFTDDGKPRHGVVVDFHDGVRED